MTVRHMTAAGASLVAILAAAPALAQTSAPAATAPAAADQGGRVEEIVVTAQRREENLQTVPLAVTAFSPRLLEAAQIKDTTDLVRFVPSVTGGLNTGTGSALTFFIRGLGATDQIPSFDVPVATYIDEIYIARQTANAVSLFDIEQTEVLRGPQGTLFGRNTTGGAVSIVTRKPAAQFGGFLEGSYGSFNRYQVRGSIDVPINDKVLTKISAFHVEDDGYAKDVTTGERLNGENTTGVRGAIRLKPNDRILWDISVDYISQSKTTLASAAYDPPYKVRSGLKKGDCGGDITVTYLATARGNCAEVVTGGITSNLAIKLNDANTLNFITGYRIIDDNFAIDFFNGRGTYGGYVIADEVRNHEVTQEAKLTGSYGKLKYVAGIFFLYETSRTNEVDNAPGLGAGLLADWRLRNDAQSEAIYAQADYSVTDQLTLTAGLRYTNEEKTFGYADAVKPTYPTGIIRTLPALASRPTDAAVAAAGYAEVQSAEKVTPRFAASYKIDADKLVFVSATNGFKSGGWNTRITNIASLTQYAPEFAWSYEAGVRTQWFDHRLRANATIYHEDVSRLQLLQGSGNGQFVTRNAGDLHATGLELDLAASPIKNLDIFATGSLSTKHYGGLPVSFGSGGAPCSRIPEPTNCTTANDDPVRFPDAQASVGATYRVPLPALNGTLSFNGAFTYSGHYWTSTYNDTPTSTGIPYNGTVAVTAPLSLVPVTELFNFGIVFKSNQRWELAVECSNCTKEYYSTSSLFGFGYYNDPQRFTVRAKYSF